MQNRQTQNNKQKTDTRGVSVRRMSSFLFAYTITYIVKIICLLQNHKQKLQDDLLKILKLPKEYTKLVVHKINV